MSLLVYDLWPGMLYGGAAVWNLILTFRQNFFSSLGASGAGQNTSPAPHMTPY